jgi:glycerol-3-phosphate acyltransferase PlsY
MTESRWNPEKPLVITAICIIGVINAIQMINLVLSPMSKQLGAIYPLYFTLSVALSLACIGGLWLLKRWAALVYGIVLICNQIVLLMMGYWSLSAAIIPAVIIVLLYKNIDKMS